MQITYGQAIIAINKNAEFQIRENNLDTIEWYNNTTPIAKADILAKQSELQTLENNKPNVKASGNQKLLDLGLTQAEATALTGYTPPSEE